MNLLNNIFDNIGKAITSTAAVIFVLLMVIIGMILFSHTLFLNVFPSGMQSWEKTAATWFVALGWEFTVLLTTVNTKHINRHIPSLMAICSGVIVLFFIQAFDGNQSPLILSERWFVSILVACINYIYAELFYAKWKERNEAIELPAQVDELQKKVNELQSALTESERSSNELESALNQLQSTVNEKKREFIELEKFKARIESELTCPHCNVSQHSYGTLHAHKGHCNKNPKNNKL